jgi:hypothetical protein
MEKNKIIKKLLLILLCLPMIGFGQSVPQGINYQAVARDANGDVLMNQALTIQFSVISDITTSAVSWQETHTVSTNDYGLYTAIIGQGIATSVGSSATFDVIDWGASNHLLKVEIDYGSGLVDMGTTAFMSVPYALYSVSSATPSAVTYSIGDTAQGGIVFYVTPDGKNGLVAATVNQSAGNYLTGGGSDWWNASDIISNPLNHTLEGQKFLDWRLPTKYELNQLYLNLYQQGLWILTFGIVDEYWSSTEVDSSLYNSSGTYTSATYAWCHAFTNMQLGPGYSLTNLRDKFSYRSVRAVRAF